jgi:hypothetical protein
MPARKAPPGARAKCTQFKKGSGEWNQCMGKTGRIPGGSKPKPKPRGGVPGVGQNKPDYQ